MNPPSLITKEQKAHQLWGKFSRQDQEAFWNDYEKLIPQNKPYKLTPKPTKHPDQTSLYLPKRLVFKQPTDKFIRTLAILLVTSFITIPSIVMNYNSEANFILLPFAMGIFLLAVVRIIVINANNFEVNQRYFCVHRFLMFTRVKFKWKMIQAVHIENDNPDNGHDLCIHIHTQTKKYKFNYELDNRTHDSLMKVLRQKVPNTVDKRIAA